ncbi:hypothetical protein BH10BDE1_BH10BDE1_17020 [soil metagenome]
MKVSRRQFLTSAATLTVAGAIMPYAEIAKMMRSHSGELDLIRAGQVVFQPGLNAFDYLSADDVHQKSVFEWNIKNGNIRAFDTSTVVHVVETHPIDANLAVLGTKRTDQISMIDWNLKKEIFRNRLPLGQHFYGHAVFSDDGKYIVTSVHNRVGRSQICILEVPSLKIVDSIMVPHGTAHEMVNVGKNQFLFGVGNDQKHSVAFGMFDLATKQIIFYETEFGPSNNVLSITHLKDCGDRYIANVNLWNDLEATRGALVSIDLKTKTVKTEIPLGDADLLSEMLSFEFEPFRDHAWITLPRQNQIKVWNLKTDSLVKTIGLGRSESPTAVTYLSQLDLSIVTTQSQFFAFDAKTFQRREAFEKTVPNSLLCGGVTAHTRLV